MSHSITDILTGRAANLISAVFGAFLSLAFLRNVTPRVAVTAITSGVGAAYFFTDAVATRIGATGDAAHGVSFLLGLFGMTLIAGAFQLGEKLRADPVGTIKSFWPTWGPGSQKGGE